MECFHKSRSKEWCIYEVGKLFAAQKPHKTYIFTGLFFCMQHTFGMLFICILIVCVCVCEAFQAQYQLISSNMQCRYDYCY